MIRAMRVGVGRSQFPRFTTSIDRFTRRGANRPGLSLTPGQQVGDFTVLSLSKYKHSNSTLLKFRHPSGLQYFHVDCPAIDNTFAIILKNNVMSDQGEAYVLEKMLQCGCNKYQVKDAIEEMKNRSFNCNNLVETNQDYMVFPFQTHTTKDFYNLMDVYFHMVYNPLLKVEDFMTTRGYFRFVNNNPKDDLEFVGPVYDEALTSEQMLEFVTANAINEHLFEKKFSPLGKSQSILHLTYQKVKNYHRQNFTLSNSMLYSYGDLNPLDHIQNIEKLIRDIKIPAKGEASSIKTAKTEDKQKESLPKTVQIKHLDPYTVFMLSYRLGDLSPQEQVRLQILSYLLFDLPDSPLQRWLSLSLPFPKLYGMRGDTFNIGMCFDTDKVTEALLREKQIEILNELKSIVQNGFPHALIETCLSHLEANSMFDNVGLKALSSFTSGVSQPILDATPSVAKLSRQLLRKDVFGDLIKRHLLSNNNYIRIVGQSDSNLTQNFIQRNNQELEKIKQSLNEAERQKILGYRPSTEVQDPSRLPIIKLTDYEFIQENKHQQIDIAGVKGYFLEKSTLPSITLKFDITDLPQDYFNVLEIFCKALPAMGYRAIDTFTYEAFLDRYIHNMDLWFSTSKDSSGRLKLHLFMEIQFLPRNAEFAFNILNGLINRPNLANLTKLSQAIHKHSSELYNKISQRCTEYGVASANNSINAFLKLEDPSFHTRSACSVVIQMLKVTNPKNILTQLADRLKVVHQNMVAKNKIQILLQCQEELKPVVERYLGLALSALPQGKTPEAINTQSFVPAKIKTYFPNFAQGFVFESFPASYLEKDSPAVTVLASTINESIRRLKMEGGCLAYKGSLNAFIRGDKKQFLDLEKHYYNTVDLDAAKRRIFQHYREHSILHQFKNGVNRDTVRYFKQAVLASTAQDVQTVRDKYIGQALKAEKSSMVILGPHLENYEGLIKSGWMIERMVDETSLKMQSTVKSRIPLLENTKYLCIS